jgi:hypothetical protein
MSAPKSKTLRKKAAPEGGPLAPMMVLKPNQLRVILTGKIFEIDLLSEEVREYNRPTGPA